MELFPTAHLAGVRPAAQFVTRTVVDPCCGTGILSEAARMAGYDVLANDLYDWGYTGGSAIGEDFLSSLMLARWCRDNTVFLNPPFSRATDFVDRALQAGARKVVCFQRQAWRESQTRRAWWDANPPARIWLCGDRATCWLMHLTPEQRAKMSGTATPHAWYVWERGQKGAEMLGTIWKEMAQ